MKNSTAIFLFLYGLGAHTKVYLGGAISLSELVSFPLAPVLFFNFYKEIKRNGFLPILILSCMMIVGCFCSCQYNDVPILPFIKSSMTFYSIFANTLLFYILLRRDFKGLGWFFFGEFLSLIITIWAFDPRVLVNEYSTELVGQEDIETKMEGVLFWFPKINRILVFPLRAFYMRLHPAIAVASPLASAVFTILASISGRSSAATLFLSTLLISIARRSRRRMRAIGKHFVLFSVILIIGVFCLKEAYSYAASKGMLGEDARSKYYAQTHGDSSLMRILMSGRVEFFIAIRAMLDNPILGGGPYAKDTKGYTREFLMKYGDRTDYEAYINRIYANGIGEAELLPQHSIITQFWGSSGIIGLIFCLYLLYLIFVFFKRYAGCIPHWYGYFSLTIPISLFSLFFNPYGARVEGYPLLITCLLFAKAVGQRKMLLPAQLEMEALKYE